MVLSYQTTRSLYAKLHGAFCAQLHGTFTANYMEHFVLNYTVPLYYTARYFYTKQNGTLAQPHSTFPPQCKLILYQKQCTPAVKLHGAFIQNHTAPSHQTTRYLYVKSHSTFTPNYTAPLCKITQYLHTKLHGTFM